MAITSRLVPQEIVHFYDDSGLIATHHRELSVVKENIKKNLKMPFQVFQKDLQYQFQEV